MSPESSEIHLFASGLASEDLRAPLTDARYNVRVRGFHDTHPLAAARLCICDTGEQLEAALTHCRRIRGEQRDSFTPILLVTGVGSTRGRLMESGADAFLTRPFEPAVLLAAVQALLRVKERHDHLATQAAEADRVSKRLQAVNQQMDLELDLARRLQESFLPQTLPQFPRVRFAVKYRPASRVGGDFYDVFRLDENHVAFYVADAMGHGVPASLLTIFVKQGVKAKEITGQTYRLVPPNEVLFKLNHDLVEQHIPDLPFITMMYVIFNCTDGTLQFSRAGHPYPVYIPKEGTPALWQLEGSLLGVFDTKYRVQSQRLQPGDKLLLYTDGMDGASFEQHPVGLASLLAAAERFRALPIGELVERLASDLFTQTKQNDDLTVFGVEFE